MNAKKLRPADGAGVNRIVKCNHFQRRIWAGAHQLQQSRPGGIGTSQCVLAIASANVAAFHNREDIAGVDRLAIGMIRMARNGSDQVSPNQLPIFQARVFCGRTCDSGIVH